MINLSFNFLMFTTQNNNFDHYRGTFKRYKLIRTFNLLGKPYFYVITFLLTNDLLMLGKSVYLKLYKIAKYFTFAMLLKSIMQLQLSNKFKRDPWAIRMVNQWFFVIVIVVFIEQKNKVINPWKCIYLSHARILPF